MKNIRQIWNTLRSSLWFVPGIMLGFSIGLAFILIKFDTSFDGDWMSHFPRFFGLGAEGSRGMLTAIAGSMLTVATLAFSLTLTTITQAAAQYSPRILRNFMSDRTNQVILGYFVSDFAYCLIVLRTIRGADEGEYVPSMAIMVGLLSALGGIVALIYFIHHIASSLQVSKIIEHITDETLGAIKELFPHNVGEETHFREDLTHVEAVQKWQEIPALESGYVQYVDLPDLIKFAERKQILIRMECGIGQFVRCGATLAGVAFYPENPKGGFGKNSIKELNDFFDIYQFRTVEQDVGFGIRQLVDIALKALSPGINDTTTAINCIDYLSVIIGEIANRKLPDHLCQTEGKLRVLVSTPTFLDYVETAFDQIRISGSGNQAVFERQLEAIASIARSVKDKTRFSVLLKQISLISEFAEQTLQTDYEKQKVKEKIEVAGAAFYQTKLV